MHVHTKRKPLRDAWCLVVLDVSGRRGGWRSWHVPLIYFLLLSQEWEKKYFELGVIKKFMLSALLLPIILSSLDEEGILISRFTQLADSDFVCLTKRGVWVISSSERFFWHSAASSLSSSCSNYHSTHDSPRRAKAWRFWKGLFSLSLSISPSLSNTQLILNRFWALFS